MNKYLILFISFIGCLLLVTCEDTKDVRESYKDEVSVYVFNDMSVNQSIENPDTSDVNIYIYFVICFYSLLYVIITIIGIRKLNKYVNLSKL